MARASRAYSPSRCSSGCFARAEKAEGIEIAFEVSPLAEGVEDALASEFEDVSMTAALAPPLKGLDFGVGIMSSLLE
jgi:hypothetical protein